MRREQIQQAALELFTLKGFAAVKMVDISEQSELSIATLYLYYKSKDDLYASLIEIALEDLHTQVGAIYENKKLSPKSKILAFKDALYQTYQRHPTILNIVIHVQLYDTLTAINPDILDRLNDLGKQILKMFTDTFNDGVRNGKFKRGKAIAHADILWSTFIGLYLFEESKRRLNPKKDFFKATLDRAYKIICDGIARTAQALPES
ncbi:TetR/AcrR family transcriptional regulator [Desulfosarcina cetonica]|uniref:TetR/AcrR family transcriptional regulator n=1 Tax=Desulfosarcina cetonica TaxID=90730 RepID=UPI00155DA577|nr:TetR/AcrR family transcriptional regulator [Desulfosarcina cetonica]